MVEPQRLDPPNPRPGQVVAATARVRNVGEFPVNARCLLAAGRGSHRADWSCANEDDTLIADFVPAEDVVIQPGAEYTYYGLSSGRRTGSYFAEMAYRHAGTELWRIGLAGTNRVVYTTACGGSTATSPLRSLFSYLPAVVRPAGR